MENAKCKRREVAKNKNYARRGGRKPKKRMKMTKGNESLQPLRRTRHKRGGQGVDGMFLRGLCTQIVTKGSPCEVKKTRKSRKSELQSSNNISNIIDIGNVYLQKGKLAVPTRRRKKAVSGCRDSRRPGKSCSPLEDCLTDSSQDIIYSLSPISPPQVSPVEENTELPSGRRKLDLEEELRAFALKYEAVVGAQILCKLPENGVMEDALTALRKLQQTNRNDDPEREEPLLGSEVEFWRNDIEPEDYILRGNLLVPEGHFMPEESFLEPPLDTMFVINAPTLGNVDTSPYLNVFDGDGGQNVTVGSHTKDFQKPVKELSIATPPIQFYRRNMF